MTPDLETLLKGATTWREQHEGIALTLSHHGFRDPQVVGGHYMESHPGTWCYYLHLTEQMFRPEDWQTLFLPDQQTSRGITQNYDGLPDFEFHGGCTFYEKGQQWDKHLQRYCGTIKVGCDYDHLWDREAGYPDDYDAVLHDARHSVDKLIQAFPSRNLRCEWSGRWGESSEFYTAVNGRRVHQSHAASFGPDNWPTWSPATSQAEPRS